MVTHHMVFRGCQLIHTDLTVWRPLVDMVRFNQTMVSTIPSPATINLIYHLICHLIYLTQTCMVVHQSRTTVCPLTQSQIPDKATHRPDGTLRPPPAISTPGEQRALTLAWKRWWRTLRKRATLAGIKSAFLCLLDGAWYHLETRPRLCIKLTLR